MKKCIYFICTLPITLIANFFYFINFDNIRTDTEKCLVHCNINSKKLPALIIKSLIAAEDHRFYFHQGIDQIAILRALYVWHTRKVFQGASTIEQQFVRVVTNRYERTYWRKIREQILAILVLQQSSKEKIAQAYITIGFLGSGCDGIAQFLRRKKLDIYNIENNQAYGIIARLKYPEPLTPSQEWCIKINLRCEYIDERLSQYNLL